MELVEIKGLFQMDAGAPSPLVLSNDNELFVSFYANKVHSVSEPQERNTVYDEGVITLRFNSYIKYTFGFPNDETLSGHPYNKFGLESYAFYEVMDSDFIRQLMIIDSAHPYHTTSKWKEYKHYVLTFHDNMFECVAKGFELREENSTLYNEASRVLNEISAKQF